MNRIQSAVETLLISLLLGLVSCSNKIVPVVSADKIEIPNRYVFMGEGVTGVFPKTYYKFSGVYPEGWPANLSLPTNSFVDTSDGSITSGTLDENWRELRVKMLVKMDLANAEQFSHKWFDLLNMPVTFAHISNSAWKSSASVSGNKRSNGNPYFHVALTSDTRLQDYTVFSITYMYNNSNS